MALQKIKFPAGIVRDRSRYDASGAWWDCDRIRFRNSIPQPIGGWQKFNESSFVGSCRSMLPWSALSGTTQLGLGTHKKLYVVSAGVLTDITPLRRTVTLGSNPIATSSGTPTVTITDTAHGANPGDYVTISGVPSTINGITTAMLNKEHVIVSTPTGNTYTITVSGNASGTGSGGGASVVAEYQINVGADSGVISGAGWGAGAWSRSTWSSAASASSSATGTLRIWSMSNWGEDMISSPRNGGLYYWDVSSGGRASLVSAISGATGVPTFIKQSLVTDQRSVMCFGVNPLSSSVQDPLLVRWSDTENYLDFTPTSVNAAGSIRLNSGSTFISAVQTRQEILAWTDQALHSIQYVGGDFIYGQTVIAQNVDIAGPNARAAGNDIVIWMGRDAFYMYDGRVRNLDCPVWSKVFNDFNKNEAQKVFAGVNSTHSEYWFFYPSASSSENDKYVVFNVKENAWYFGTLARTAWVDHGIFPYPLATGTPNSSDGYVYYQEYGIDDGSTNPAQALGAYIESAPFELGEGDHFMYVHRLLPDISFEGSTAPTPTVDFTFKPQNFPGSALMSDKAGTVTRSSTVTIEQFDEIKHIRFRARSASMRIGGALAGVKWKVGAPRLDMKPDGRKS